MAVSNMKIVYAHWCNSYVKHKPWRAAAAAVKTASGPKP